MNVQILEESAFPTIVLTDKNTKIPVRDFEIWLKIFELAIGKDGH